MTVRANKPAFSIREKLKELQKPIGLKGSELMRAETAQEAGALLGVGRKNMLINGDMRIDQRQNGSLVSIPNGAPFISDRWRVSNSSQAVITAQQITDAPPTFSRCLSVTVTTADTDLTSNYSTVEQRIEGYNINGLGWGTSGAKYATLSFYVKSNLTGQYGGSIRDADDATSSYTFNYTINSVNTWEYKTITIPPRTTDTWLTTNAGALDVIFSLATGSFLQGASNAWNGGNLLTTAGCVNFAQTVGNNFRITGIQFEVGKNATEFEHRSYGEELALCQRYYYRKIITQSGDRYCLAFAYASTTAEGIIQFPVPMRTRPTSVETTGTASNYALINTVGSGINCNSVPSFYTSNTESVTLLCSVASGLAAGQATALYSTVSNTYLGFSAEL